MGPTTWNKYTGMWKRKREAEAVEAAYFGWKRKRKRYFFQGGSGSGSDSNFVKSMSILNIEKEVFFSINKGLYAQYH